MRRAMLIALVLMAPIGAAALATPASASIRRCGNAFSGADQPGFDVRALHIACSSAKTVTREWVRECVSKSASTCTVHTFHCRKTHTVDLLYRVHCIRRIQRFSFGGGS
jgi:hypothetical protein